MIACLICLPASGCLRASNETVNRFVFKGPAPIGGVVYVIQNEPVLVGALDQKGAWITERRDVGQFVLMAPDHYRRLVARLRAKETPPTAPVRPSD